MFYISDLVATEHQLGEIGEVGAYIIDIGELIIRQLQELYIQLLRSRPLHYLLNSPISDLLVNQRNKLLLLLVDVLHHLWHQVIILRLHFGDLHFGLALLERQSEYYVAVFECFCFLLGVELRDQVYLVLCVSVIKAGLSFYGQLHKFLRIDVFGLHQKANSELRNVLITF